MRHSTFSLLIFTLAAAGCSSSEPANAAHVRLMHVRDGAPAIDLAVNGETVLEDVSFSEASELVRDGAPTTHC